MSKIQGEFSKKKAQPFSDSISSGASRIMSSSSSPTSFALSPSELEFLNKIEPRIPAYYANITSFDAILLTEKYPMIVRKKVAMLKNLFLQKYRTFFPHVRNKLSILNQKCKQEPLSLSSYLSRLGEDRPASTKSEMLYEKNIQAELNRFQRTQNFYTPEKVSVTQKVNKILR